MSRELAAAPPSRPTLVDYFFLLVGCALSLALTNLLPMAAERTTAIRDETLAKLADLLPQAMRLPEGVVLMWPFFFFNQRLLGRAEGLTSGEWLWVIAWLGVALLTGVTAWKESGKAPEFLMEYGDKPRLLWYQIVAPSMAVLSGLFLLFGVLRRGPAPWTHALGLVLVSWPVLPLAGILSLGELK
jgi:hypothetical protein